MTEREFLRCHIEASWGVSIPPLENATIELSPGDNLPPWSMYQGRFSREQVTMWRPDVLPAQRTDLLQRAQRAGVVFDPDLGMRREVVLRLAVTPSAPSRTPRALPPYDVRHLNTDDAALLEAFEAGSAPYYLSQQRAPCIGVIVDGRLVSVGHSSRRTRVACALGINTAPEARRRGYAAVATTAWTQAISQEGLLPIYSALARNTASLRLAAATGYVPVSESVYGPVSESDG